MLWVIFNTAGVCFVRCEDRIRFFGKDHEVGKHVNVDQGNCNQTTGINDAHVFCLFLKHTLSPEIVCHFFGF